MGFRTLNLLSPKIGTVGLFWTKRETVNKDFQSEYVVQRSAPFGHVIGVLCSVCNSLLRTLRGVCFGPCS